jgi:DNA-binding transcriptional MerR regulator
MDKEELKKQIYTLIEQAQGKKKYKQMDVIKHFRALGVPDSETKEAIRELVDGGQLIYTYMGGSYIELASKLEKFEKDIFK